MAEPVGAPFTAYIGGLLEEMSEGYARISLLTGPSHSDALGRIHTGVLTSLMDSAIGIALGNLRGKDSRESEGPHATIEMSTSFYGEALPGDELRVEGRVTALSGRIAFGEVETHRESDGELLAKARLTFAIPGRQA